MDHDAAAAVLMLVATMKLLTVIKVLMLVKVTSKEMSTRAMVIRACTSDGDAWL